jgi:AcrR family transcriptional regulator
MENSLAKGLKKVRSRVERGRETTSCRLLEAATKVFGKFGCDGSTTKMIAKKAGINEALIARYFGGKSGLVSAVILESIKKQEELYNELPPPTSVEDEILTMVHRMIDNSLKNGDLMKVLISRAAFDQKTNKEIHEKLNIYGSPTFKARLSQLREQGKIDPNHDLDSLTFAIWLFCLGNVFTLFVNPPNLDMDKLEKACRLFSKEFARSLAPLQ